MNREVPRWLLPVVCASMVAAAAAFLLVPRGESARHPAFCSAVKGAGGKPQAPLGLFVHYGPSSLVNESSTVRWWRAMVAPSYARAVARFRPKPSVVDGWFDLARRAGARYVAVIAKHHDGYALWNSSTTSYTVGKHDLIARAALDARRSGLGLVLYFSLVDEHVASYDDDWPAYLRFVKAQLRELLTRYGPIAGVWFDGPGWADGRSADEWGLPSLYAEVHRSQPDAEIITNHHCARPLAGEGALTFENEAPRRRAGFPQQIAYSLSDQWFYSTQERPHSHRSYLALRARARRVGAGLLVNVPPRPDGTFAPEYVRALLGR